MKLEYLPETERIKIKPENNMEARGIKSWLDRHVDGYMFDPAFKNKLWNGKKTLYNKEDDTVPMGLWREVFKCCEEFGYPFEFINKEEFPLNRKIKSVDVKKFINDFFKGYQIKGADFEVRDYQTRCAISILKNRYCNIAVATSGGKTLIYSLVLFYLLSKYPKKKFLLIVPSKTLVTQFYNDIQAFNWNNQLDINVQEIFDVGENPRITFPDREPNLVIGTFQSLVDTEKFSKDYFQQFWSATVDECLHPNSLITMSDNTIKEIKDISVGEYVKTINEKNGTIENKLVEYIYKNLNKGQQMYELEMVDGSIIKITGNHKVYLSNKEWVKVEDLNGDEDILHI